MQRRHLFIVLAFALFASPLAAQETTGTIQGRVVDAQGLAVPGATVTVTGPQGSKNTVTDADGRFTIPFLTPGIYAVRAELQGFKAVEQKDVVGPPRTDGRRAAEDGGRRRRGNRPGHRRLAGRRHHIDDDRRGASTRDALEVDPGRPPRSATRCTSRPASAAAARVGRGEPVDVRRQRPREPVRRRRRERHQHRLRRARLLLDRLRLARQRARRYDFVKEVQVKTGGYEAEFGQATGGVVNVVTKSGTNELRGSAVRLRAADAASKAAGSSTRRPNGTVQHRRHADSATSASKAAVRSSRTGCSSSARSIRRGRRATVHRAARTSRCASLGDVDRERQTDCRTRRRARAAQQRAPHRRVVLRRSVARRRRPAAHLGAARQTTRPASARSTTAATTRRSATTAC